MKKTVSRRALLQGAVGLATAALTAKPAIVAAQERPIRIGQITISSGRVAQIGITSKNAIDMEIEAFNKAGGLNGRMLQLVTRDSKGKPDDAARFTRELIETEQCSVILDCEGSGGAFAVHEVLRDNRNILGIHCLSETSQLSADPKLQIPNAFRTARQGVHDSIVGGSFAAKICKQKNLTKWATIAADYAYGREATPEFLNYVKAAGAPVTVVAESWPKLFQPDYTENITKILQAQPQAMFCGLWGGDLVAFIDQGSIFGLFDKVEVFSIHMADYTTLTSIKNLPQQGVYSSNRYVKVFPDTQANKSWAEEYHQRFKSYPTNWSWEAQAAIRAVIKAIQATKSADVPKLAEAMRGMEIDSPVGAKNGKMLMRKTDQTVVNYALGWGRIVAKEPYLTNIDAADWDQVTAQETEWKKARGYA